MPRRWHGQTRFPQQENILKAAGHKSHRCLPLEIRHRLLNVTGIKLNTSLFAKDAGYYRQPEPGSCLIICGQVKSTKALTSYETTCFLVPTHLPGTTYPEPGMDGTGGGGGELR